MKTTVYITRSSLSAKKPKFEPRSRIGRPPQKRDTAMIAEILRKSFEN